MSIIYRMGCLGVFLIVATGVSAQSKSDKKAIRQLQADIGYLASDELEGRRTGTEGEHKAGDYIIKIYEQEKIGPYKGQYRYPFHFVHGKEIDKATVISIDNNPMRIGKDAFPLPFTGNQELDVEALPDVMEQGNAWILPLYQSKEEADDPHFDWEKYAYNKTREAIKNGATGVLFYDSYGAKFPAEFNGRSEYEAVNIPVGFIGRSAYESFVQHYKGSVPLVMHNVLKKTDRTGNNIAAYIDNKAKYTVILGAHYDHLGYGEDGSSLYAGKDRQIHNGADDNASGTAALLQLANWIRKGRLRHYNYLFLNFSGEELGLLGSKAFIKEQGIDSAHTAYMINMDMVGRLHDSTRALTVGGVGTSPVWGPVVHADQSGFKVHIDSSGIGPSDHTSFYYAGIPALFFFTGTHSDYHKPSDDADKINYTGELQVMRYIYDVVKTMDSRPKPVFTTTKQTTVGAVRFKVTLGIMPDYTYEEEGVRIDGISEGKTADKAGLKAGDVIIKLGSNPVKSMQSYMEALSKFKEGDKTNVVVKRNGKEMTFPVQFK